MKCNEKVVALVMSLTNEVNENESSSLKVVLEAINECERQKSDFHSRFDQFEFVLQWYWWCRCYVKVNKTLTNLDLSDNGISNAGATSIAEAIKVN
ncbi:hypothetical protein pdam_00021823 [Pocillopora damicornis]|uniref:Uncharacterized protein n=1 Tax=Pocillopora damicornis TaxID=46731 RepID=A0A3M6UH48_POCDA|nr:hypothetical protein pdam_00021823 [Pocillopora damicornis]